MKKEPLAGLTVGRRSSYIKGFHKFAQLIPGYRVLYTEVKERKRVQDSIEFWDLYRDYGARIYNYLLWYIGNRDDAEDLTGAIFLKAREQVNTLRNPDKAQQWLWSIGRNSARNFRRDRKETVGLEQIPEVHGPFSDNGHRIVHLKTALNHLAAPDREILILREYHGFSYAELAELLETSVSGIKSRLFRARENLRERYFNLEM